MACSSLISRAEGHLMESYRVNLKEGQYCCRLFGAKQSCSIHFDVDSEKWYLYKSIAMNLFHTRRMILFRGRWSTALVLSEEYIDPDADPHKIQKIRRSMWNSRLEALRETYKATNQDDAREEIRAFIQDHHGIAKNCHQITHGLCDNYLSQFSFSLFCRFGSCCNEVSRRAPVSLYFSLS